MKISRKWLQTYFDTPLPSAEALSDTLTFHAFEIDGIESHDDDHILDVKITANRGHDCLSHRGIAKEISAILDIPLSHDPFNSVIDLGKPMTNLQVTINTPLCHRYIGGYIKGVKVGPSPEWLVERLSAMGQKSINNIVDATNFVMFNIGQPLHAFDAHKLTSQNSNVTIEIRNAKDGEGFLSLDDKQYSLNPSMLVISNADTAIGVAGVKGGMPASITPDTVDIIIESANFDGPIVRKSAQHMKIRTDASARFEQHISPELAAYGMRAVTELIVDIAGGDIVGFTDSYPTTQTIHSVTVSHQQINSVLGITLSEKEIASVFDTLGLIHTHEGSMFTVTPPVERLDISIPEDLIEEVGRIIGYDEVPSIKLPTTTTQAQINQNFAIAEKVREDLMSQGYTEVFTSVFADRGERIVANKVDGVRPYMRNTLTDGLTEALKKNTPNKDLLGLKMIKLFEIGTVWKDGTEIIMVGTITEKGLAAEKPLMTYASTPETAYESFPLSITDRYMSFSRYPYIVRDIALWVPKGTEPVEVLQSIRNNAGPLLVRSTLFDTFEKGDKTSLAFRLVFQSFERTLTDDEVNTIMSTITNTLTTSGFEIR